MSFFFLMQYLYFFAWAYVAWRIISGLNIRKPYGKYIFAALMLLAVLSFAAFVGRRSESPLMSLLLPLGYICTGVCGITCTLFIVNDIVNLANIFFKIKKFRHYSTLVTLGLSVLLSAWALFNVAFILNVKEVRIKVPELGRGSFKIVQISDLHINKFTSPELIKRIFDKAVKAEPDIIVLTGDIIDTDINKNDEFLKYGFAELKAPYGVFAVTGNHERRRLNAYFEMCRKLGIKVLKNESVLIEDIIWIAGINDADWRDAGSIKAALSGVPYGFPAVFLSHRPETFNVSSVQDNKVVQLSGHTHAGQIPPIEIVRNFFMKYNYGLYENNGSVMYLTSGTRWWGPPMRLFNSSEIAVVILER